MKSIIVCLLAAFAFTACSNHGKKIKIDGTKGEVYYKGDGVTEEDAKKTGEFLKNQGFFTNEKGASVQISKEADEYTMRFVYNKKVYDTLKGADNAFKLLAIQASKELFGNKKVKIALASKTFKDFTTLPYDEALAKSLEEPAETDNLVSKEDFDHDSAGEVDFYWRGISDEESKSIADYIVQNGSFAGGTAELYMTKENGRYIIRFPVIESGRNDPSVLSTLDRVTKEIKDNVFANVPFTFHMTDERFNTIKSWEF